MNLYTRKGDDGTTGMLYGERVLKNDSIIHVIGEIDELNCVIGLLLAELGDQKIGEHSVLVQQHLFSIGASMAEIDNPSKQNDNIPSEWVLALENEIDALTAAVPPLQNFILPGGSKSIALAHLCRSVCRRAERSVVALNRKEKTAVILKYLNRLSDYYFALARKLAQDEGVNEVIWKR